MIRESNNVYKRILNKLIRKFWMYNNKKINKNKCIQSIKILNKTKDGNFNLE